MATLESQLEALKKARRSGVKTIEWDNKKITYKSDAEMDSAIRNLEHELGIKKPKRTRLVAFDKGF